ncbi:hypothetical protein HRQ91_07125 [Treponema parvum]|uniref:PEGA domain-containing protein n=1 Tax=Treponema parvum TaxID=138851 RepID=A0A975F4S9_9SPIR|nr:hypothetical protein [Treponema parvum]QTQ14238.1 hypothetical protein HRQ91_07125 [Treponema parvum]
MLKAQMFRVHKTVVTDLSVTGKNPSLKLGINDALAVFFPKDMTYLQGLYIDIKIPSMAAVWQDSMAWSLFDKLSPSPSENGIDYSGKSIASGLLPQRLSWSVSIPLTEKNTIKDNPYSAKMGFIPDTKSGFIFLRLQQVMKGTPDEFDNLIFEITVKPILINKGKLELEIVNPNGGKEISAYSLFLDEKPFEFTIGENFLDPGNHTLSLISEFYRNEVRTVHVEQAKTTQMQIRLRSIEPTAILNAPGNAAVFFDGDRMESGVKEFVISEGEHTVNFVLGNYEVVKKFTAIKGQSYSISLNIEAVISEEN